MFNRIKSAFATVLTFAIFFAGCAGHHRHAVEVETEVVVPHVDVQVSPEASSEDTYEPQLYLGNVVLFTSDGRPFIYRGDDVLMVPQDYSGYTVIVSNYRNHFRGYNQWWNSGGYHYRHFGHTDVPFHHPRYHYHNYHHKADR